MILLRLHLIILGHYLIRYVFPGSVSKSYSYTSGIGAFTPSAIRCCSITGFTTADANKDIRAISFCLLQILRLQRNVGAETQDASDGGANLRLHQSACLPVHIHHKAATGTKSLYASLFPGIRQGWQEMHGSIMTLQEHLSDTGCYSEVAVYLEWRMGIEEIRIGSAIRILLCLRIRWQQTKHIADDSESMIAIEHACPEVRLPTRDSSP